MTAPVEGPEEESLLAEEESEGDEDETLLEVMVTPETTCRRGGARAALAREDVAQVEEQTYDHGGARRLFGSSGDAGWGGGRGLLIYGRSSRRSLEAPKCQPCVRVAKEGCGEEREDTHGRGRS